MAAEYFSAGQGTGAEQGNLDHIFSVAYEELLRLANLVKRSHPAATVSPGTLVNEAWIKLSKTPDIAGSSPLHFKRVAARAMRQVLVSAARRRFATKRGANLAISFDDALEAASVTCDNGLIALDDALGELARMNPPHAQIVESRFFGGLENTEIATLLGISEATVLRDWRAARAWLAGQLSL